VSRENHLSRCSRASKFMDSIMSFYIDHRGSAKILELYLVMFLWMDVL
jgi:hypothetical protein